MLPSQDEQNEAARTGREAAGALDQRLRQAERLVLRGLLSRAGETARATLDDPPGGAPGGTTPRATAAEPGGTDALVERLRRDIERLAQYQAAVEASRVWQAAQWARRVLGRRW